MIASKKTKHKNRLSKTTIMSIKMLARKGRDQDLEDFIFDVVMNYIAAVRDTDYIDEEDYIKIKGIKYDCKCPYCGELIELDLGEIEDINEQENC